MDKEIRHIKLDAAEIRVTNDTYTEGKTLEGYASVFNVATDLGRFSETIERGAFSRAISEDHDVRALVDHDSGRVLGRTKNGTLELREDKRGLFSRIHLPDTQEARDLATLIKRGDLDGMSFGFTVERDRWEKQEDRQMRFIEDVNLFEVSVVAFPAYEDTEVALLSMPDEEKLYGEKLKADTESRKARFKKMLLDFKIKSWQ